MEEKENPDTNIEGLDRLLGSASFPDDIAGMIDWIKESALQTINENPDGNEELIIEGRRELTNFFISLADDLANTSNVPGLMFAAFSIGRLSGGLDQVDSDRVSAMQSKAESNAAKIRNLAMPATGRKALSQVARQLARELIANDTEKALRTGDLTNKVQQQLRDRADAMVDKFRAAGDKYDFIANCLYIAKVPSVDAVRSWIKSEFPDYVTRPGRPRSPS